MSNRKGISSIIGTLIFIGILFSAVAPMFLTMRQADVFYEITKQDLESEDMNKQQEELIVYGYGDGVGTTTLTVYIQNRGIVPVVIKRVWLNDEYESVSTSLAPLDTVNLGPYNVSDTDSIALKVTTSNGNVFSSDLGKLSWTAQNGWYTPSLGISVHILNDKGKYSIEVKNKLSQTIGTYESIDMEDGDVDKTFLIGDTDSPCTVTVKEKHGSSWDTLLNELEVIVPSNGNYIVHVVVDGR